MGTFANSEDPDEMPHNAAFHHCLHCLQGFPLTFSFGVHHVPLGLEFRGHFKFYGDLEFLELEY